MALRDVQNYQFLKEALRQKFLHINDPNFTKFKGISYEPMANPASIFGRTYNVFRELIDKKGLDLKSYLNIEDKNVLERLYLNLSKDPNLKFLDHPELVQNDPKYELTAEYHQAGSAPAEVPLGATGSAGGEAISSTGQPTGVGGRRGVGIPPMATRIGTATMQSVQQGEVAKTMESPQEEAAAKPPVPKAYEKAFENEPEYKTDPTKQPPQKTTTPAQKPSVAKPGFQAPKIPAGISSAGKNFGSTLGKSFYRNIGSKMSLNSLVNRMFNVIGGLGGSFSAMGGNPGIPSGGVFGSVRRRVLSGRNGLSFRARFSSRPGLSRLKGFGTGKKVALAFSLAGLLFGFSLFSAAFLPNQTTTPTVSASNLLDYTIPFRDTSVVPVDIKSDVKASWPNARLENWDTIIQKSVAAGWNPAFVLALWIEESGAQGVASYDDALGCSPGQPTTDIDLSLSCLFNNFSSFTNDQFAQFMLRYSEGFSGTTFITNPNFPNAIKFWYSRLVPAGPGALTFITSTAAASCPVPNGVIKTPSYQVYLLDPFKGGHCSPAYGSCPSNSRRAQAIDVDTAGQSVVFPTINNQSVTWFYVTELTLTGSDCEGSNPNCGKFYIFKATVGLDTWSLHLLHLDPATTAFDRTNKGNLSGSVVGKTVPGIYVHIEIGKNIVNYQNPPLGSADLDPGWIPADFMCQ